MQNHHAFSDRIRRTPRVPSDCLIVCLRVTETARVGRFPARHPTRQPGTARRGVARHAGPVGATRRQTERLRRPDARRATGPRPGAAAQGPASGHGEPNHRQHLQHQRQVMAGHTWSPPLLFFVFFFFFCFFCCSRFCCQLCGRSRVWTRWAA